MKKAWALAAAVALGGASGCTAVGPVGALFSSVRHPSAFHPGQATHPGSTQIHGEACAMSVLGLISIGDWSVDAALRAAGAEGKTLKNVAIDHPVLNILGLYGKFCTSVSATVAG